MKRLLRHMPFILVLGALIGLGGCASNRPQAIQANEYRKMLERQKAEQLSEPKATEKIPEMTADDYERLGDRYLSQGNLDMAFIQYQKALGFDSDPVRIHHKLGILFLEKGLLREAEAEFQQVLNSKPNDASIHEGLGKVAFRMDRFEEAERNFQRALQLNAGLWQAHNYLGVIYDRQGRYDDAIRQFQAAISLRPDEALLYNNLGMSLLIKGDPEKALRAFQEGAKIGGIPPKMHNNLALALCKVGRCREALEALKKSGDEASAYYRLGNIYLAQGKYKEAAESFEKAIELKPAFHVKAYEKKRQALAALALSAGDATTER